MKRHLAWVIGLAALSCQAPREKASGPAAASAEKPASTAPEPAARRELPGGIGSRIYVAERDTESMGVYELTTKQYFPEVLKGLGDMRHATMTFSQDLRWGYVATRSGKLNRIDLAKVEKVGEVGASKNSIDIAISQDGRYVATAEYVPGGVTIMDAQTLGVVKRLPAELEKNGKTQPSRATGIVDAPGNRFVCVLIEGAEIWVIDASGADPRIERRVKTANDEPYDAMITPDGRYYVVGHMNSDQVSVLDLATPDAPVKHVSLRDPKTRFDRGKPVKLPHMAAWAVAGDDVFVPLVGESRVVVLDRNTWAFKKSVPVRGYPVYAVAAPSGREIWVSFSGEENDAWLEVIDAAKLEVKQSIRVGGRIYHFDFMPRGSQVLVSANRDNQVVLVDAASYSVVDRASAKSPSGVFGAWRAFRMGL